MPVAKRKDGGSAQLCSFTDQGTLGMRLIFISKCLDYCNLLYLGLLLKTIQKLPLMQNAEVKLFAGWTSCCRMSSIYSFYIGSSGLLSLIHGTGYYLYKAYCQVTLGTYLSKISLSLLSSRVDLLKPSSTWEARSMWAWKATFSQWLLQHYAICCSRDTLCTLTLGI